MSNVTYIKQNRVLTDSRKLAEDFGQRHADTLRKIEKQLPDFPSDYKERNFALVESETKSVGGSVVKEKYYEMTRDGFMVIALTFNGKKGTIFRLKVLEEFNRRGAELEKMGKPTYSMLELLEMATAEIKTQTARADKAQAQVVSLVRTTSITSAQRKELYGWVEELSDGDDNKKKAIFKYVKNTYKLSKAMFITCANFEHLKNNPPMLTVSKNGFVTAKNTIGQ